MPSIVLQLVTGPGTSRRETFSGSILSFGRGGDNQIVLPVPTASRRHGELRYANGQWLLVNLSPNGTRVAGRNVTRKPCVLRDRDSVSIGEQTVFQVLLDAPAASAPAAGTSEATKSPAAPAVGRRAKMWIGIGIYLMVMTVVLIVAEQYLNTESEESVKPAPELTTDEVRQAILKPAQASVADPRRASQLLDSATQFFNKLDTSPSNLYKAYSAYRLALAYSGRDYFADGLDQRRFLETQDQLTEAVQQLYSRGYDQLKGGAYKEAEATFRKLEQEVYEDSDSPIYKNVEQQRRAAAAGVRKQNR